MAAEGKSLVRLPIGGLYGDGPPRQKDRSSPGLATLRALPQRFRRAGCSPWCFRALAATTVLIGAGGQVLDVLYRSNWLALRESHAAFGLVLLLTLGSRVFRVEAGGPAAESIESRHFQRGLKRLVYVLLYVLALIKELLIVGSYLWRGGVITDMSDDFGIYLLYGVAAIAFVPMAVALRSR